MRGRASVVIALAVLVLLVVAGAALAVTGELTQLPGTAGCVSETGSSFPEGPLGVCTDAEGVNYAASAAITRDGKNVYVAGQQSGALAAFQRNPTTGKLTQLAGTGACVSERGSGGACADGKALRAAFGVVVSGDGKNVYVTSLDYDAVAAFQRDTATGALTQLPGTAGCVSETGTTPAGDTCADGKALDRPRFPAISGDGKTLYVPSQASNAVAVFDRNPDTGALTQLPGTAGCVSETGTTPAGDTCADGKGLDNPFQSAVSPDRRNLYVVSLIGDSVAVFQRDRTTGALTQPVGPAGKAGCVSETGSGGACADGKALDRPFSVAVSRDGENAYIASVKSDGVAVFARDTTHGTLSQLPGTAGCVTETGTTPSGDTCADGKALTDVDSLTVSPDGLNVYVAAGYETYALAAFARDPTNGRITQLPGTAGCISQDPAAVDCVHGEGLEGAYWVIVSPSGNSVYLTSVQSDAVAVFARETPP